MCLSVVDVFHHIKASVRRIRQQVRAAYANEAAAAERCLAVQLRNAIVSGSSFEIAVALGSAAEFMIFPEERIMEECTAKVQSAGEMALRGVVWAVRHRCARAGNDVHRFSLELAR